MLAYSTDKSIETSYTKKRCRNTALKCLVSKVRIKADAYYKKTFEDLINGSSSEDWTSMSLVCYEKQAMFKTGEFIAHQLRKAQGKGDNLYGIYADAIDILAEEFPSDYMGRK